MADALDTAWGIVKTRDLESRLTDIEDQEDKDRLIAELRREIERLKLRQLRVKRQEQCECEHMPPEDQPCNSCLNQWRNERYGSNVHDVECVCDQCSGFGYRGADY